MTSNIKIDIPSRATQAEIDALPTAGMAPIPPGTRIFNTTTNVMNISPYGGATPGATEWFVDTLPGGANRIPFNDITGNATSSNTLTSGSTLTVSGTTLNQKIGAFSDLQFNSQTMATYFDSPGVGNMFLLARGRGTESAKVELQNNDVVGQINAAGVIDDGVTKEFRSGGTIAFIVDETPSTSACPMSSLWQVLNEDTGSSCTFTIGSKGSATLAGVGTTPQLELGFSDFINTTADTLRFNNNVFFDSTNNQTIANIYSANTTDSTITYSGITLPLRSNFISQDGVTNGSAYQLYSNTAGHSYTDVKARGRGTAATPLIVNDNDIVHTTEFVGTNSAGDLIGQTNIVAQVDGTPTATAVPISLNMFAGNPDNATYSAFTMSPDGYMFLEGIGGSSRTLTASFNEFIDFQTNEIKSNSTTIFYDADKKLAAEHVNTNTTDTNVTYSAFTVPLVSNFIVPDGTVGGSACQVYSDSVAHRYIDVKARGRGTAASPVVVNNSDLIHQTIFAATNTDGDLLSNTTIITSVDGIPTATAVPIKYRIFSGNSDTSTSTVFDMSPDGSMLLQGNNGTNRKLELDFQEEVNISSSEIKANAVTYFYDSDKKFVGEHFTANTTDTNVTLDFLARPVEFNAVTNDINGGYAAQLFNNSGTAKATFNAINGRGTYTAKAASVNGDDVFQFNFAGTDTALSHSISAHIRAFVNEAVTATTAPVALELASFNLDTGANSTLNMNPDGSVLIQGQSGANRSLLLNFDSSINLQTSDLQLNGQTIFNPIYLTAGYTSTYTTGSPAFTTPIAIAYSAKPEGTWTKITGMSSLDTNGDISFASDTVTINEDGHYNINVSISLEVDVNAERISAISVGINEDDTDKVISALIPSAAVGEGDSSRFKNLSVDFNKQLTASDTLKLFYSQVNEGGTGVDDVNISAIRISVNKLGLHG